MTRFAPIAPPHILRELKRQGLLGNYHLLLAHYVVAEPAGYTAIFEHLHNDPDAYVVMDNSLWELGHPVDVDTMHKACQVVKPTVVVLPDHLADMKRTLKDSEHAVEIWGQVGLNRYMGVTQGKTFMEICECGDKLMELDNVRALGIPRIIADKTLGSRGAIVRYFNQRYPHTDIHLLGFSISVDDDMRCVMMPGVVGIDSSEPIRAGLEGELWSPRYETKPRGNYWDYKGKVGEVVTLSLSAIRRLIT